MIKEIRYVYKELTFKKISEANAERCEAWHSLFDWSATDWATAMMGEAGELCNVIKKMRRKECHINQANIPEDIKAALAEEVGDTFIYLDLLCQRLGLDLDECVANTYNRVSIREGLPHRLVKEKGR